MRGTALAVALLVVLAACRPTGTGGGGGTAAPDPDGTIVVAEVVGSPRDGDTRIRIEARRRGEPVDDARVVVTGDMTHAGMPPFVVEAASQGDGWYLTPPLEFPMAGDWILTIDVAFAGGDTGRETRLLSVPRR